MSMAYTESSGSRERKLCTIITADQAAPVGERYNKEPIPDEAAEWDACNILHTSTMLLCFGLVSTWASRSGGYVGTTGPRPGLFKLRLDPSAKDM